jgi:ATP-dependent exoDNAse (exonuclease V) beta subunit
LEPKINSVSVLFRSPDVSGNPLSPYDASAGSEKRMRLSKNEIILVAPKMMPIAILAITFTNKAVHEMKSRIVGSLSYLPKTNQVQKHGSNAGFIH